MFRAVVRALADDMPTPPGEDDGEPEKKSESQVDRSESQAAFQAERRNAKRFWIGTEPGKRPAPYGVAAAAGLFHM